MDAGGRATQGAVAEGNLKITNEPLAKLSTSKWNKLIKALDKPGF
jgi:hypothetical protein